MFSFLIVYPAYEPLIYVPTVLKFSFLHSQPGTVLIMKGHEELGGAQPLSRVIQPPHPAPKVRYDVSARRTGPSAGNKATAGPEGEFPCKKCGRSVVGSMLVGRLCKQARGRQMLDFISR